MHDVLHEKSLEVDLGYYENPEYYDTFHRAQKEAPYRPTRIVNGLVQLTQNGISLVAMVGLLVSFHWLVAAVLLAATLPGLVVRLRHADRIFRWHRDRTPAEREAWYLNWMITSEGYAKEVRLFDLGDLFKTRFHDLRGKLRKERIRLAARRSTGDFLAQTLGMLAVFGSFGFIAFSAVYGRITVGDLVMYFQAFTRGQSYLQNLLGSLAGLYEDNLFLSNLSEFLSLRPAVVEPANPIPVPSPLRTGIAFESVGFIYPSGERTVLSDISLRVGPGEVVALVGENGSGKTTLIKLLCRLYDPTHGRITLDGLDLRSFDSRDLRRQINVIFQDYARYHLPARDNIWFGDVTLAREDDRIVVSSRGAGAHEAITGLPQGYETVLGRRFNEGVELSVGEWQKVALARALMRDAQIIVLDEPTSSMDAKAEFEFFERFRALVKGQAAILISHRFSTVRMADRIYVLERGGIVEEGSHRELMTRDGTYARLFRLQATYYT